MDVEKVVVVGQGYVGLPVAIRAVEVGYDVVGFDLDKGRIDTLRSGESYVEDITADRLRAALDSTRFTPSSDSADCANFDIAVVSVPTPLSSGDPDLSYIEDAAAALAQHLKPGATVILESTTYPGTTEELVAPILENGSGLTAGTEFHLGYSPERIDPGNAQYRFENTPKVVSGIDSTSLAKVQGFFDRLVEKTVPVSSPREAELTKLLENTFRHVNIALVNELAMFAHDLGIDVWEAIDATTTKPFGYLRFTPGPGVGGHCLPVDPSYLSWSVRRSLGLSFRFIELANDVNDHMPDYVLRRIAQNLNERSRAVNGSRIVLLGLAYKRNTGDARESPSRRLADLLLAWGADVAIADPHAADTYVPAGAHRIAPTPAELEAADLVVLLVDHDAFDLETVSRHAQHILDCRHRLDGPNVEVL